MDCPNGRGRAPMATLFNESSVPATPVGKYTTRQQLLTEARIPGTGILLDRLTVGPGGEMRLTVPAKSVAWLQVLEGEAVLAHGDSRQRLSDTHIAFLPPGYSAALGTAQNTEVGAALLYGEIPNAARLDP